MSSRGGSRPQLLAQVPHFFKPTRHDAVFQGKHEAIHKVIERHREDRRKVLQEKTARPQAKKQERPDRHQEKPKEQGGKQDAQHPVSADQRHEKREAERQKKAEEHQHQKEQRHKLHEQHKSGEQRKGD